MTKNIPRKLKVVMLAILMLIEVQANDPISTTFHPSSLLIILSEPFKLDNMGESFSTCLQQRVEACKKGHEPNKTKRKMPKHIFGECVHNSFKFCKKVGPQQDPMRLKAIEAELLCLKEFEKHRKLATLGKCLTEWYNENFKKNWNEI